MIEEIERLKKLLAPFAKLLPTIQNEWCIGVGDYIRVDHPHKPEASLFIAVADVRAAADALKEA